MPACLNLPRISFLILFFIHITCILSQVPTWTPIASQAPDSSGSLMLLLSDGSVLCKTNYGAGDRIGNQWNKLTPNSSGSYINGTWSKVCPMKDTRLYFSTQTLKNGKIYLAGGEYGSGISLGEVYDPVTNTWTQLPATNNTLSDASSAILPDGRVLQASLSSPGNKTLLFNPATNTYANGPGCLNGHNESTWLKLPDNSILFVDIGSTTTERYIPALNQWVADANTPANLYDPWGFETGPGFLLPDGRAFFIGSLGNTAYYTPSGNNSPGSWTSGPTVPNNHGMPDAPGTMMVDGKIIFSAGPKPTGSGAANIFIAPTYFYEFDYLTNTFTQLGAPGGGTSVADTAFNTNMLLLPDGNMMYSQLYKKTYYVRKPGGLPLAAAKPTITSVAQNACSNTFTLTGLLFNGICEGSCYGDDWQMNTNYPIVRLTSGSNVYYARSYNWNHNGVRNYTLPDTTLFQLPPGIPIGTYSLYVVANGNASNPITFTFNPFPALTSPLSLPDICSGNNFVYNSATNPQTATAVWTRPAVNGISNAAISTPQTTNPNEVLINTSNLSKTVVYSYTLTNGSCVTNYQVNVVVHPVQSLTITSALSVCEGVPVLLKAKGAATYTWSNGGLTNSITVSPSVTTVFTLNATDYNGCPASQQRTISVLPKPTLSISAPSLVCKGQTVIISATGNGSSFLWSSGLSSNSFSFVANNEASYTLTAYSSNNCQAKDSVRIKVQDCTGISSITNGEALPAIYPNPFSHVLTLDFFTLEEKTYRLKLYNVLGTLLKEERFFASGTNHTMKLNCEDLTIGVYVLTIDGEQLHVKKRLLKE